MLQAPPLFHKESELPINPKDQVFIWEEPDTKIVYHFNSTAMFIYWKRNPDCGVCAMVPISKDMYEETKRNKGIEKHRLDRMTKRVLRIPTMWAEWEVDAKGEPWHICFDGSHRIVWAYEHGIREIRAVIFKRDAWSKCLIKYKDQGMDQFMPKGKWFSGIW
jgi:hypothetical protein